MSSLAPDHVEQQNELELQEAPRQAAPAPQPNEMRFVTVEIEKCYFREKLEPQYINSRYALPQEIVTTRNRSIILSFLELFLDLASLYFYIRRRGRIILAVTIGNFIFWGVGMWASLKLSYWGLLSHSLYGISIVGGFYAYILIDGLIISGKEENLKDNDDGQMNRFAVRLFSSLPHLGILLTAIYSCILLLRLDTELESRKKEDKEFIERGLIRAQNIGMNLNEIELQRNQPLDQEQVRQNQMAGRLNSAAQDRQVRQAQAATMQEIQQAQDTVNKQSLQNSQFVQEILEVNPQLADPNQNLCVICVDKVKEIVFYPCGHQIMCTDCSKRFQGQARHMICPMCRNRISDMIKVYR